MTEFMNIGLDHFIGEDAGEVRLDGAALPGVLQRMDIRGRLKVDKAEGLTGGGKSQPLGFQAATIFIELILPSDAGGAFFGGSSTCYDKLGELNGVFTAVDVTTSAKLHRISNSHANARGIEEVWFMGLDSEEAHNDTITARITLEQKEPPDFAAMRTGQLTAIQNESDSYFVEDSDAP